MQQQERKRPKKKNALELASLVALRISLALPCLQSCLQTATLASLG